jgi:glycosyltransferase involved in cell wall biosynthesis
MKLGVFPSYINCGITESEYQSVDKEEVKNQLGIPLDAIIVGGCGLLEWRKGIDIFNYTALQVLNSTHKKVHFIWVGVTKKSEEYYHLMYDLQRMGILDKVHLIEGAVDNLKYMACFDVFFMSSREDPYPLVMIEAGLNKTPVVCFENSGGAVDFVGNEKELIIPYLDIKKASEAILQLIDQDENRHKLGAKFNKKAWDHDISVRGPQILSKLLEFEKI